MLKYILKFGAIVGLINACALVSIIFTTSNINYDYGELVGYGLMLAAFAVAYVGIKRYRDEQLSGYITFGSALFNGLMITLVASTIYVFTWLLVYYNFVPDFMENYADACFERMKRKGLSEVEISEKMAQIADMAKMYKSSGWIILITYAEILPVGILASLVSALVLRKRQKNDTKPMT